MSIETLGDAFTCGWRITAACAYGHGETMKRVRECTYREELDMPTLLWTRGRAFPLARLESRLKCPRCGSRRVRIAFTVPPASDRARAVAGYIKGEVMRRD